ncbi:MAG: tetratricopeptide repeat protein [Bacteroidota bacterium]
MDKSSSKISQEQQATFERFLMNQMHPKEATVLKNELEGNPKLKKQFEDFKALFLAIEEEGLRKVLDDFHNTLPSENPSEKKYFHFYRIAAGIAILMALGLWFFNRQSPNERLFNTYFTPDPGLPTVMGTQNNFAFYDAMVDYKQGNYDTAIKKWDKLLLAKPNNDTLNYFLGVANMAKGDIDPALYFLQETLKDEQSKLRKDALYYLALAQLKNDDLEKATKNLKMLSTAKSRELLEKLEN